MTMIDSLQSRVLLSGGTVIDGTGAQRRLMDVLVEGDRIVFVGDPPQCRALLNGAAARAMDCSNLIVAPGFIDAHSHSDLQVMEGRTEKLLQGVTSEVVGNCGFSAYPLPPIPGLLREFANGIFAGGEDWGWPTAAAYLESARRSSTATVVSLVGHGSLRIKIAGNTCRDLTLGELDRMCGELDEALQQGASGLSSGLMYAPGSSASAAELSALCKVVARRGGVYATHMRDYASRLMEAVEEQIAIAQAANCQLEISHMQAVGRENWPLQQRAIEAIERASLQGVDVAFDAYPWLAGSTVLTQLLPQSALDGGHAKLMQRLNDPIRRENIRVLVEREHGSRWNDLVISSAGSNPDRIVGRSLLEIAQERQESPSSAVLGILLEQGGHANIIEHNQSTDNLRALLTHPLAIVVTDGLYTNGLPHPRLYGTFPLWLGDIVRERRWLRLEDAVQKITGTPAALFHLDHRGTLSAGNVADITVFDASTIATEATYESPRRAPKGIRLVMKGGVPLVASDMRDIGRDGTA